MSSRSALAGKRAARPRPNTQLPLTDVRLDAPYELARWRPLVNWLFALPHMGVLAILALVRVVMQCVALFQVLLSGTVSASVTGWIAYSLRYEWRTMAYVLALTDTYPPFELDPDPADDGAHPAQLSIAEPGTLHRGLALVKWLLVLPHALVLTILLVMVTVAAAAGGLSVAVSGRYPASLRVFLVGTARWYTRVQAYAGFLTDDYPPFSLR